MENVGDQNCPAPTATESGQSGGKLVLQVMRENGSALRRYVQSRIRDAAEVDDIMQDIYMRVLQNSGTFAHLKSQRAYTFRIARNLINDCLRQRQARTRLLDDLGIIVELDSKHAANCQERMIRAHQGGRAANRAMQRLKQKHRDIFCLSRMEGLSNNEIASRLGVSLRSVERHVSEVSLYIRETLAGYI